MQRQSVIALGESSKGARIYLQGRWLAEAGFLPSARYEAHITPGRVTLRLLPEGARRVSAKHNGDTPVIDLENPQLREAFSGTSKLQVTATKNVIEITPARTVLLIQERRLTLTEGSLFSGGGFLTEAARSLGFTPRFAVELEPKYAEIYAANHPSADVFNCSVEEVAWESLRVYRPLGLLTMGIPCEPFSQIRTLNRGGQEKRDRTLPPEAHENGDMVWWGLRAIDATNPHTVLVENVPAFIGSAAYFILTTALRRLGYNVDAKVINPLDYGELTSRKRAIIIARTGAEVVWPEPFASDRQLGEILDPDADGWFNRASKPWLFDHWQKQTEKGNGFAAKVLTAGSRNAGTCTKRMLAQQGNNPVVAHPKREGFYRWFTVDEIRRLHGVREDYWLGGAKTTAGEALCQGIVVPVLASIIAANSEGAGVARA